MSRTLENRRSFDSAVFLSSGSAENNVNTRVLAHGAVTTSLLQGFYLAAFMYTRHPSFRCIQDVSNKICQRCGLRPLLLMYKAIHSRRVGH